MINPEMNSRDPTALIDMPILDRPNSLKDMGTPIINAKARTSIKARTNIKDNISHSDPCKRHENAPQGCECYRNKVCGYHRRCHDADCLAGSKPARYLRRFYEQNKGPCHERGRKGNSSGLRSLIRIK